MRRKDFPVIVGRPAEKWDEAGDYYESILEHIGRPAADGYFKREMIRCGNYGPQTIPLPFAYPDGLIPDEVSFDRSEMLFWAGKRQCGLRSLYLHHLAQAFGFTFDRSYDQGEYVRILARSKIGMSFFGLGFDTVRYWELPAHGCMLFSEKLPIRVPHDFVDGKSAVLFEDLYDLEQKLAYYLAHPEEIEPIARKGRQHLLEYHTGSARARQFLNTVESILAERTT